MEKELKQRNGCISVWLWIALLVNIGLTIYYVVSMFDVLPGENVLGCGLCSILGLVNVLSVILLLRWNKSGFYMLVLSSLMAIVINIFLLRMPVATMLSSLLAIVVWWAILQIKKEGVSAWSQLQSGWDGRHNRHLYQLFGVIGLILFVMTLLIFGLTIRSNYDYDEEEDIEIVSVDDDEIISDTDIVVVEEQTVAEKNLSFLKLTINESNKLFPQEVEEGLVMTGMHLEGDYVMYDAECDEDIHDMDLLEMNRSNMRAEIKKNLGSSDPEIQMFRNTCIKAEKGIGYRYVGDTTGKAVVILIPYSELKDM